VALRTEVRDALTTIEENVKTPQEKRPMNASPEQQPLTATA
jgi:hypothetical protein